MAVINRADLPADLPEGIPTSLVPFAPLGGEVRVRGLSLGEQMAHTEQAKAERVPRDGEPVDIAERRANGDMAVRLAAVGVVDEDGRPLLSFAQWAAMSARHGADVFGLAGEVMRLSGADAEAIEKN